MLPINFKPKLDAWIIVRSSDQGVRGEYFYSIHLDPLAAKIINANGQYTRIIKTEVICHTDLRLGESNSDGMLNIIIFAPGEVGQLMSLDTEEVTKADQVIIDTAKRQIQGKLSVIELELVKYFND